MRENILASCDNLFIAGLLNFFREIAGSAYGNRIKAAHVSFERDLKNVELRPYNNHGKFDIQAFVGKWSGDIYLRLISFPDHAAFYTEPNPHPYFAEWEPYSNSRFRMGVSPRKVEITIDGRTYSVWKKKNEEDPNDIWGKPFTGSYIDVASCTYSEAKWFVNAIKRGVGEINSTKPRR